MAGTYILQVSPPPRYRFSRNSLVFQATLTFKTKGFETLLPILHMDRVGGTFDEATWQGQVGGFALIPERVLYTYKSADIFSDAGEVEIEAWLSEISPASTSSKEVHAVDVLYVGRAHFTLRAEHRIQMISTTLRHSLEPQEVGGDDYDAIGPQQEGATRLIPMDLYDVTEIVGLDYPEDYERQYLNLIAGCVCEAGWPPPWRKQPGGGSSEGEFMYFGVTSSHADRASRTLEVTHSFSRLLPQWNMGNFRWLEYHEEILPTGKPDWWYGPWKTSKVAYIAGTDKWPLDPENRTIPRFADLNLTAPIR